MPAGGDPLRIGTLELDTPFVLAPMAGYTDAPFRRICQRFGAALTFTEMVNARGVSIQSPRTMSFLETLPGEPFVAAHIYGSEPSTMGECAARISALDRFASIDINVGCPMPKIMRNGAGATLMDDPARVCEIVASVCEATELPVTVKTRLGIHPSESRLDAVILAAAAGGASAVIVHARYAEARHGGEADWAELARAKREALVPIIGNGGATDAARAVELLRLGLDGVMIGRGAIGRPWIFAEAAARLDGVAYTRPSTRIRRQTIAEHLRSLVLMLEYDQQSRKSSPHRRWDVESAACRIFRRHLIAYLADAGSLGGKLRHRLMVLNSVDAVLTQVDRFLASLPSEE